MDSVWENPAGIIVSTTDKVMNYCKNDSSNDLHNNRIVISYKHTFSVS